MTIVLYLIYLKFKKNMLFNRKKYYKDIVLIINNE